MTTNQQATHPILDQVSAFIAREGRQPPVVILHDFRGEEDYRRVYPEAAIPFPVYRNKLSNDLLILQIHGIPTGTAVIDADDLAAFDGPLEGDARISAYGMHLMDTGSPDIVFASGYPAPRFAVGRDDAGNVWAVDLRDGTLCLIEFGAVQNVAGGSVATVRMYDRGAVSAAIASRLVSLTQRELLISGSPAAEVAPWEPMSPRPPTMLLLQNHSGDVGYFGILCGKLTARLRTDAADFVGVSHSCSPALLNEMRTFAAAEAAKPAPVILPPPTNAPIIP